MSEGARVLGGHLVVVGRFEQAGSPVWIGDESTLIVLIGLSIAVLVLQEVGVIGAVVDDAHARHVLGVGLHGLVQDVLHALDFHGDAFFDIAVAVVILCGGYLADVAQVIGSLDTLMALGAFVDAHGGGMRVVALDASIEAIDVGVLYVVDLAGILVPAVDLTAVERKGSRKVVQVDEAEGGRGAVAVLERRDRNIRIGDLELGDLVVDLFLGGPALMAFHAARFGSEVVDRLAGEEGDAGQNGGGGVVASIAVDGFADGDRFVYLTGSRAICTQEVLVAGCGVALRTTGGDHLVGGRIPVLEGFGRLVVVGRFDPLRHVGRLGGGSHGRRRGWHRAGRRRWAGQGRRRGGWSWRCGLATGR